MEGLSARHSHSHHTLVSELPDPSNSHGDNTVKEGKSHTPGQTFHWNINQKNGRKCYCFCVWACDQLIFPFFCLYLLRYHEEKCFKLFMFIWHGYSNSWWPSVRRRHGLGFSCLTTTQHESVNRNFVLLSLLVSQGILWYLMSLCSKQLLDFAEITRIFI